jgi:hypothetical protein
VIARATALVLLAFAALCAGEPLVCRGFDAASAVNAITSASGRLLTIDADLRGHRLWFILGDLRADAAKQALAHGLACWWSRGSLTRSRHLPDQDVTVRSFPPLPSTPAGAEPLLRRLLEPWLADAGGLAADGMTGGWIATAAPAGLQRLEFLLAALGDPAPRAPHLLPSSVLPVIHLARAPRGEHLGDWAIDLGRVAGLSVALGPDLDPQSRFAPGQPSSLAEAVAMLASQGVQSGFHHGVLCLAVGPSVDRQHPAERATVAILPTGHLTHDADRLSLLAARLGARVLPEAWDQPGWAIAPLVQRNALLVVAAPEAIHAVMAALEAADQTGLDAWLR